MRTAAYKVGVASDRRRRKNVPRHILCSRRTYIFGVVSDYTSSESFFTISGNSIKWEALTKIVSFSLRICSMFW
jgi:hypothetical protein